jgi:release factor glutamine methyltransferase
MKPLPTAKHLFMAFWYLHVKTLNRLLPSITVQGKTLVIFPEVYKPLENEQVCAEYCHEGDRVLDLGCGSGVATMFCAPMAREVVAVDISLPAVRNTEMNCRLHKLKNVKVLLSDMFSGVEGRFDIILANPPYIDDEFEADQRQFATSRRYMPALFAHVSDYLADGGRLVIQSPSNARSRIERLSSEHGLELVSVRPLPAKNIGLWLLSLLYLQIGFKSALYLLRRSPQPPAPAKNRPVSPLVAIEFGLGESHQYG